MKALQFGDCGGVRTLSTPPPAALAGLQFVQQMQQKRPSVSAAVRSCPLAEAFAGQA